MSNFKPQLHFERFEFKYLMNERRAHEVLQSLFSNNLSWDPYVQDKEDHSYTVTSLYYDSPTFKCYEDKIAGLDRRFKLRERIYEERLKIGTDIFYEVKNKKDAVIIKNRQVNKIGEDFNFKMRRHSLSPKLLVAYERQALQGRFQERLRVTFDRNLRTVPAQSLTDFAEPVLIKLGLVIMEIKYNETLPGWFQKIIGKHDLERAAFSKYCVALESCMRSSKMVNYSLA